MSELSLAISYASTTQGKALPELAQETKKALSKLTEETKKSYLSRLRKLEICYLTWLMNLKKCYLSWYGKDRIGHDRTGWVMTGLDWYVNAT